MNFFEDMGLRPGSKYSLERINNDEGYEPGNCKWATRKEQSLNKRSSRLVVFHGIKMNVSTLASKLLLHPTIVLYHLNRGVQPDDLIRSLLQVKKFVYREKEYTINQLSELTGISTRTLRRRLDRFSSVEEAISYQRNKVFKERK